MMRRLNAHRGRSASRTSSGRRSVSGSRPTLTTVSAASMRAARSSKKLIPRGPRDRRKAVRFPDRVEAYLTADRDVETMPAAASVLRALLAVVGAFFAAVGVAV